MTTTVRDLLLRQADQERPGLLFGDRSWTWAEYVEESAAVAGALATVRDPERPLHVGALLDNVPEMAFLLAGAALGGSTLSVSTRPGQVWVRETRGTAYSPV